MSLENQMSEDNNRFSQEKLQCPLLLRCASVGMHCYNRAFEECHYYKELLKMKNGHFGRNPKP